MTNPKIRIGADFSDIEAQAKKLRNTVEGVNKALSGNEVGVNVKEAEANLAALEEQAHAVAAAMAGIGDNGKRAIDPEVFAPYTKALVDAGDAAKLLGDMLGQLGKPTSGANPVSNAKAVADQLTRAARAQRELAREGIQLDRQRAAAIKAEYDKLRKSGARGTSHFRGMEFDDWLGGGWQNESVNLADARRKRRDVMRRIGIEPPAAPGTPAAQSVEEKARNAGVSSTMMRSAGRFAGAAAGAVAGAASGGGLGIGALAGAGVGAIPGIGLVAGPLAGVIGGMIDKALESALAEATDLADMRRAMGATVVSFDELRKNTRAAADGLGITYEEAAKLARQFSHTSGVVSDRVGAESGDAAGFGRGYGMEPGQAVQFFATMRHFGASQSEKDSKRLALSVAEAINKGGMSPKADEALAAIQNYVQASSRASMTETNVRAYASFMSSLTGLQHYGIKGDPEAAAGAMGKADAAIRQGGAFGEASKSFSLGIYQRALPGFSAFDMKALNEQGAFGSAERAFAKDSPAYQLARERGDKGKMAKYDEWAKVGGDTPLLAMHIKAIEDQYGSNTDAFSMALQSHLGVGAAEASALYQAHKSAGGLDGLQKQLQGAGVNIDTLNTRQIASLAEVATGSDKTVRGEADKLLALDGDLKLSDDERTKLEKALAEGRPEEVRKVVLGLSALHDTTVDEGDRMRNINAEIRNATARLATKLIPLAEDMKGLLARIANKLAPENADTPQGDKPYAADGRGPDAIETPDGKQWTRGALSQRIKALQIRLAGMKGPTPQQVQAHETAKGNLARAEAGYASAKSPEEKKRFSNEINQWAKQEFITKQPLIDGSAAEKKRVQDELAMLQARQAEARAAGPRTSDARGGNGSARQGGYSKAQIRSMVLAEAKRQGATPEQTAAILGMVEHESSFRANATGKRISDPKSSHYGDKAFGPFQYMAATARAGGFDRYDPVQNVQHGVADFLKHGRQKGGNLGAIRSHFTGPGNVRGDGSLINDRSDGNQRASEYTRSILDKSRNHTGYVSENWGGKVAANDASYGDKVPTGQAPGIGAPQMAMQELRLDNRVILLDRSGNEIGNTSTQTQTKFGLPTPSGVMRG